MNSEELTRIQFESWFETIRSVAEPTQPSFSWGLGPDLTVDFFNWFENENFVIGVRRYVKSAGLDIRVFHKDSHESLTRFIFTDYAEDDFRFLLSCLGDTQKLTLCVSIGWASEFIESVLKGSLVV